MSQFKKGADALGLLNQESNGSSTSSEFAKFKSGTTLKVKVQGIEDIISYVGYGVFKKVNTFVAKNPSTRNDRGYVESNPTPWDQASQHYYDKAKAAADNGASEDEVKVIRQEAYKYAGKERYAIGFHDLTDGADIVVDFTKVQAKELYAIINKYGKKLDKMAFELSKQGARQDTKVTLMPIIDMDDDLTDKERANFEKAVGQSFNSKLFEGLLFEADEKTQKENLVAAGFDLNLIGLTLDSDAGGNDSDFASNNEVKDEDFPF